MLTSGDLAEFSPDGLNEPAIDALISEVADELGMDPTRLGGDPLVQRHERRSTRRVLGGKALLLHIVRSPVQTLAEEMHAVVARLANFLQLC